MSAALLDWRPATTTEGLEPLFRSLADQWREDTRYDSFAHQYAQHPAYLRIIGMGPAAVPLILRELPAGAARWFVALRAITGADPVAEADRGKVAEMAAAWRAWGRHNGLST